MSRPTVVIVCISAPPNHECPNSTHFDGACRAGGGAVHGIKGGPRRIATQTSRFGPRTPLFLEQCAITPYRTVSNTERSCPGRSALSHGQTISRIQAPAKPLPRNLGEGAPGTLPGCRTYASARWRRPHRAGNGDLREATNSWPSFQALAHACPASSRAGHRARYKPDLLLSPPRLRQVSDDPS
jgi:hypothetical protein